MDWGSCYLGALVLVILSETTVASNRTSANSIESDGRRSLPKRGRMLVRDDVCTVPRNTTDILYYAKDSMVTMAVCKGKAHSFNGTEKSVILAICQMGSGKWAPDLTQYRCEEGNLENDCQTTPVDPPDSIGEDVRPYRNRITIARYLTCNPGMAWLTGLDSRLMQCVDCRWTPINDSCEADCNVPRDCEDVWRLGFNTTGYYQVTPSGFKYDVPIKVWCEMFEDDDGVWTNVLDNNGSVQITKYLQEVPEAGFIGLANLMALNRNATDGSPRPLVFQFLVDLEGVSRHVTYDNVVIGPRDDGHSVLMSLGNFHGDAGDVLSKAVGTSFNSSYMWWIPTNASHPKMTPLREGMVWGSEMTTHIRLRVRTKEHDEDISCPGLNVLSLNWTSTPFLNYWATVPLSRGVGARVTYQCKGERHWEGARGTARSQEGVRVCEAAEGGALVWNDTLVLPCLKECPKDFHRSVDDAACYHFSRTAVTGGVIGAARECYKLGSTLALIDDPDTVPWNNAAVDKYYLTLHLIDFPRTNFSHLPPSTCGGDCDAVEGTYRCVVAKEGFYKAQDCNHSTHHYMCRLPGKCRENGDDFYMLKGRCYKAAQYVSKGILGAQRSCEREGGMLAYPETLKELQDLISGLKKLSRQQQFSGKTFNIGLNNASGDWTSGGVFSPDSQVVGFAEETSLPFRHYWLAIDPAKQTNDMHPVFVDFSIGDNMTVLCQYPGVPGCRHDPPPASANMTQYWNNSYNLGSTVTYKDRCLESGKITVWTELSKCLGMMGGWWPPVEGCPVLQVCEGSVPAPTSPLVTNYTEDSNLGHHNASISYTCPEGMATASMEVVQNVTCIGDALEGYWFEPNIVQECSVCVGVPIVGNATTDHNSDTKYMLTSVVVATCNATHVFTISDTQPTVRDVTCTESGWEEVEACYEACEIEPPINGSNTVRDPLTTNAVGTVLNYTCVPGYYLHPLKGGVDYVTFRVVNCTTNHVWDPPEPVNCFKVCEGSPPVPPANGNRSWTNESHEGVTVTYSCPAGLVLGDRSPSLTITCLNNNTWTHLNPDILQCRKECRSSPPPAPTNTTANSSSPYWEGQALMYSCLPDYMSSTGGATVLITCTNNTWTTVPQRFTCVLGCFNPAPVPPGDAKSNDTHIQTEGTVVGYTCGEEGFDNGRHTVTSTCMSGGYWSPFILPGCDGTYL